MTRRNQINLVLIAALSASAIFSFHLNPARCIGLFLVLAVAPKLFWASFDYLTNIDLSKVGAWFRSAHPVPPEDAETKIELAS
jgi:hypothetical protein